MDNTNELYSVATARAKENGVADQEAWDSIVDEVVEQYRTSGQLDDDDDLDALIEELRARFPEYEENVREEGL